jgi:nucleotide-binding universal stress UspA family protein
MNILAAIDFSDATDKVLRITKLLGHSTNAKVWLVHVAEPDPDFVGYKGGPDVVRDQVAAEYHEEHRKIQAAAEELRADGIETTALLMQGSIVETILDLAKSNDIDLLVAGSHGHGAVYDMLIGSISEGIVRKAPCPVTLVPTRG